MSVGNLIESITSRFTPDVVGRLAGSIGNEPPAKTGGALASAVPSIFASLMQRSSTTSGAASLLSSITGSDASKLDDLSDPKGMMSGGSRLASSMLGEHNEKITDLIASSSGIGRESSAGVMSFAMPLIAGVLGKEVASSKLDGAGLSQLLWSQKENAFQSTHMPKGILAALGFHEGWSHSFTHRVTDVPVTHVEEPMERVVPIETVRAAPEPVVVEPPRAPAPPVVKAPEPAPPVVKQPEPPPVVKEPLPPTVAPEPVRVAPPPLPPAVVKEPVRVVKKEPAYVPPEPARVVAPVVTRSRTPWGAILGALALGVLALAGLGYLTRARHAAAPIATTVAPAVPRQPAVLPVAPPAEPSPAEPPLPEPPTLTSALLAEDEIARTFAGAKSLPERFVLPNVEFESGSATMTAGADSTIDMLATSMKNNPSSRIRLEGFTDREGRAHVNSPLSLNRANVVKEKLVDKGIDGSRIETVGRQDRDPVGDNASEEGRRQNRRTEAVLLSR
jgi:outer membrane protein OmpA-like peptidoglycan-associated protein